MENILVIHTDGGSRGNPGPAACAFSASINGQEIFCKSKFLGTQTNNFAEYQGVLLALEWLIQDSKFKIPDSIVFILDSELVVKQLNGLYKIKNEILRELSLEIKKIIKENSLKVIFKNVRREENKRADELVNIELDVKLSR